MMRAVLMRGTVPDNGVCIRSGRHLVSGFYRPLGKASAAIPRIDRDNEKIFASKKGPAIIAGPLRTLP
jgi:hypothetical protein